MLKKTSVLLVVFLFILNAGLTARADEIQAHDLISETVCLMDADTGQVLFEKNMHKKMYPASITKIITAIVAIENADLRDIITMSDNAVFSVGRGTSHISLTPDEQLTLKDALYAAMLMSANDACNGIAEHVGGTIAGFVAMMNKTARKAGTLNTSFNNSNGLKDSEHYTSAYDMAMITRYALENPTFTELFGTYTYEMPPNNKQPEPRPFANQHCMIANTDFRYDGIIGGKAGYTTEALYTLVTAAERTGRKLIAVVMKSPRVNDKYTDTIKLLDYGFNEFKKLIFTEREITDKINKDYIILPEDRFSVLVLNSIDKNDIEFKLNDEVITLSLKREIPGIYSMLGEFPFEYPETVTVTAEADIGGGKKTWIDIIFIILKYIGIIAGGLIGLLALLILALYIRRRIYIAKKKRRRKRRK